jgi:hypothetical protein
MLKLLIPGTVGRPSSSVPVRSTTFGTVSNPGDVYRLLLAKEVISLVFSSISYTPAKDPVPAAGQLGMVLDVGQRKPNTVVVTGFAGSSRPRSSAGKMRKTKTGNMHLLQQMDTLVPHFPALRWRRLNPASPAFAKLICSSIPTVSSKCYA